LGRRPSRLAAHDESLARQGFCLTAAPQCLASQSRAARCAAAISASDISAAISRRYRTASLLPRIAARLNHLGAETRSAGTERPVEYLIPKSNSTSPEAYACPSGAPSTSASS